MLRYRPDTVCSNLPTRMHSSRMRTTHSLPYGGLPDRDPLPGQRPLDRDPPPGQRTHPLDRDPSPGQRSTTWTEIHHLDRDPPPGQRSPWAETPRQRPPWTETPLDRDPWTETLWTETPWRDPPGPETPPRLRPPGPRLRSPLWTDKHLWKHYLPATSFAGAKNRAFLL